MIKVLLTGTTRAGKSTLLQELKKQELSQVAFLPELALELLQRDPSLEQNPQLQDILFSEQRRREIAAEEEGAVILFCDRGIPDNIAHARIFGQEVKPEWIAYSQTYDRVFLCDKGDIHFNMTSVQSTLKDRNWLNFRDAQDTQIKEALSLCELPYITLSGSVEKRIAEVESALWPSKRGFEAPFLRGKEG